MEESTMNPQVVETNNNDDVLLTDNGLSATTTTTHHRELAKDDSFVMDIIVPVADDDSTTQQQEVKDESGGATNHPNSNNTSEHHFLQGIRIDGSSDLLSILPDPPKKRRLSLLPPLRDLTNSEDEDTTTDQQQLMMMMSKSLQTQPPTTNNNRSTNVAASLNTAHGETTANDETVISSSSEKNVDDATEDKLFAHQYGPPENTEEMRRSLEEARKLIHAYTNSSIPQERQELSEALEKLANYPLTPPVESLSQEEESSSQDTTTTTNNKKRCDLLQSLGPQLQRIDQRKHQHAAVVAQVTACRVQKTGRGSIRYYHTSRQKVHPAEYEQRYRLMLEEVHDIQSERWRLYFAELRTNQEKNAPNTPLAPHAPEPVSSDDDDVETDIPEDDDDDDPELAQAQAKLWDAIDGALETYSQEVLKIRAKRQRTT